jgi:predicted RNA-binding Zn-ribbon protein involved in translation (DUF1610 family)
MQFARPVLRIETVHREQSPMMLFVVAPISFTKLVAANPAHTWMIGFVRNENCVSLQMKPINNRSEPTTKRTTRTAHVTSTPESPAPQIFCPTCDRPLIYRKTVVGGVKPLERWDYFECRTCGHFVYRDRTRQLRPAI